MDWGNLSVLLGLWILPAVAALLFYAHRKRMATARRFADPAMVQRLMPPLAGARPWVKAALILMALALLIVAAARPRFGVYFEKVSQRGMDLFVLLDVSRSMTAEDVAPNRLQRAKSDLRDLLARLSGDRVGLIVFAGKPAVKVPLTTDQGFFRMVLDEIDTQSAPRGGTLIGDAIRKALEAMPERRDRDQVLVLITDGEDQESYPEEAAKQAAQRGIKIIAVGLGDSNQGARIPIRDQSGGLRYLKYQGQEKWSKLNERILKQIALTTGGVYIPAGTRAYDLGQIYEDHLAGLARGQIQEEKRKRYRERFQLFVCLALALLLVEMVIPGYRHPTVQSVSRKQLPSRPMAVVLSILLSLPTPAAGTTRPCGPPDAVEMVNQGIADYRAGKYQEAATAFRNADVARPDDPWITFNMATAYAAQGDLDKAEQLFQQSALSRDQQLAVRSHYDLGTLAAAKARAVFGENPQDASPEVRQQGLAHLAQAVAHYRDCIELDNNHADARHNLELIRLWIKHMQALWDQRDREKQRQQMNLLEFLAMIEAQQRALRSASKALDSEPDSPKRRQALTTTQTSQRELAEEIEPLKEKITESLKTPQQPAGHASGPSPGTDRRLVAAATNEAVKLLTGLADQAGQAMRNAADQLADDTVPQAVGSQTDAVDKLDQIYMGVVPFANLVQRAIGTQQGLIDQVTAGVENPDEQQQEGPDLNEAAWNQRFVARWAEISGPKAQQELKGLESFDPAAIAASPKTGAQPGTPDPEAIRQQLEALKQSMQKAVELGPKVQELASDAAQKLEQEKPAEALPDQQQALKLLKEIAQPLPKQDQQQQGDQQRQQGDQQQDQEQSTSDQQRRQQARQPQDLSKQQAEAVLRKVRQRQRQRHEIQNQLQQYLYRPGEVEKDW